MLHKQPTKEHPTQTVFGIFGEIHSENDSPLVTPYTHLLMDDSHPHLSRTSSVIDSVKNTDWSDFKTEVAAAKQEEALLKVRLESMLPLKKHIDKSRSNWNAARNATLRFTEPPQHSDPVKAMKQAMDFQEIRNNIRTIEPKMRLPAIAGSLARMQALIANPDPSDVIIDPENLIKLRRQYAFEKDQTLRQSEEDAFEIYTAVRRRAAEINATMVKMLLLQKIDDPVSPGQHYEVFPPQTDHERNLAEKRIQSWQRKKTDMARKKEWEDKHPGVHMYPSLQKAHQK